jgi:phenylpyruvate tautomerase PptA (4-oxalocrotonate tautomerase family)
MAKILDILKMSEPALSTAGPEAERQLPPIEGVIDAVTNFLKKVVGAKKVSITKVALEDSEKEIWEAEAEVYVPNPTISALGLLVRKEVLDCQIYLFRLDKRLNIVAYGLRDSVIMERDDLEF